MIQFLNALYQNSIGVAKEKEEKNNEIQPSKKENESLDQKTDIFEKQINQLKEKVNQNEDENRQKTAKFKLLERFISTVIRFF